jgi:hypothetical protein
MNHSKICNALILFIFIFFSLSNAQAGLWDNDSVIHIADINKASTQPRLTKNSVTLRLTGYIDGRAGIPPIQLGVCNQRVSGISGNRLEIDGSVIELVSGAMKKRFDEMGYQLVEAADQTAMYELSGVIKEFTYNVKERDEVSFTIESTLKEVSTGAIIWSGVVAEKANRFAGISGNTKTTITQYLRNELSIVTKKTADAIGASLAATRPELFNLTPGTQQIEGVVVLQAARGNATMANPAVAINGTLALTTQPSHAKIYVDGVYFGVSPLRTDLPAGVHRISIKLDSFKTQEEQVSIRNGQVTELDMPFENNHSTDQARP